jgi:hypothetical protein
MAKYKFRIEGGRYGGELAVGRVTPEFVNYWLPKIEDEGAYESFIPHVLSLSDWDDDDELDANSPDILDDGNEIEGWYGVDDYEHINSAYADGGFVISDISDEEDKYAYDENEITTDGHTLKGREGAYVNIEESEVYDETPDGCTGVMLFHSAEKGGFATWFAESDEPFDPNKLVFSIVETHLGDFVEDVWYDKTLLEADYDYNDTTGKSYEAAVGWITDKWRDEYKDPEEEDLSEYWEEHAENLEWELENGS